MIVLLPADVAELVDALASGASELRLVEVQVLLSAPRTLARKNSATAEAQTQEYRVHVNSDNYDSKRQKCVKNTC